MKEKITAFLANKSYYLLFVIIAIQFLIQSPTKVKQDDDYIGEQVYWLQKVGYVKTELMQGFGNIKLEEYQSVFHKLFIYQGYLFSELFGWSLLSLHFVSFLYLIIAFIGLKLIHKQHPELFSSSSLYLLFSVLLLHFQLSMFIFSYRPEIMIMALGLFSFYFLNQYLDTDKKSFLILSAVLAGASFLTHLNGLIFVVAGFILLLSSKKWIDSILFGAIATFIFSFYFVDILLKKDISYFIWQFTNDPSLNKKETFTVFGPIIKLFDEHRRLFNTVNEGFLSLSFLISSLILVKYSKEKFDKRLLIFTATLIVFLGLYTYSKTSKYIILYIPFLALLIVRGLNILQKEKSIPTYFATLLTVSLSAYILTASFYFYKLYDFNKQIPDLVTENKELKNWFESTEDLHKIRIIAPGDFIFNSIEDYQSVMNINRFHFFITSHGLPELSTEQFIDSIKKYNMNYVLLNEHYKKIFQISDSTKSLTKIKGNSTYELYKVDYGN